MFRPGDFIFRECMVDGTWSNTQPSCIRKHFSRAELQFVVICSVFAGLERGIGGGGGWRFC
jgi:hypothetical protein